MITAVAVKSSTRTAVIMRPKEDYTVAVILGEPTDIKAKLTTARTIMEDEPPVIDVQSTAVPATKEDAPAWARLPREADSQD